MISMKTSGRYYRQTIAAICLTVASGCAARAQEYPSRLVRIVSVTSVGNPIDEYSRRLARYLGEKLKQTVIIENRPGGNSIIAAEAVATSPPDGYTFLFTSSSSIAANPHLFKNLSYNPSRDFVPVVRLYSAMLVLAVPGSSSHKTVDDLVRGARANPGKLNSATSGNFYRILTSAFHRAAGIQIEDISYKSAAAVMNDMLGGIVDCALMEFSFARPNLEAGKLRGLALLTPNRTPMMPQLPTLVESGFQDNAMVGAISQVSWAGLFAPAGTPPAIIEKIERLSLEFVNSPEAIAYAHNHGLMPNPGSAAELGKAVIADQQTWKEMISAAGIDPQ